MFTGWHWKELILANQQLPKYHVSLDVICSHLFFSDWMSVSPCGYREMGQDASASMAAALLMKTSFPSIQALDCCPWCADTDTNLQCLTLGSVPSKICRTPFVTIPRLQKHSCYESQPLLFAKAKMCHTLAWFPVQEKNPSGWHRKYTVLKSRCINLQANTTEPLPSFFQIELCQCEDKQLSKE